MIDDVSTVDRYRQVLELSKEAPVFLFKHSSACAVSSAVWKDFTRFAGDVKDARFCRIFVIENRPLSSHIAETTGVRHESPQVILLGNGAVQWSASHWGIDADAMWEALLKYRGSNGKLT